MAGPGWRSLIWRVETDASCLLKFRGQPRWWCDQAARLCLLSPSQISVMISPLNPKECFPCYHGCTRKCEQVSRAPFWSIVLAIFTSLGSSEVLVLSRIAKPAVCLREWGNPGPSEAPLFPRPIHWCLSWRQVAPGGSLTWARPPGLPLRSPSCASQISFFVHVTLLLWFSWFLSLHQCSFLLLRFVFHCFSFFFLLCLTVSPFWTETHQEGRVKQQ